MFADRYYRPDEVASILGVDKCTVYRMIRSIDDPLPAIRIGGNGPLRVHGKDLDKWTETHKVRPEEE